MRNREGNRSGPQCLALLFLSFVMATSSGQPQDQPTATPKTSSSQKAIPHQEVEGSDVTGVFSTRWNEREST